MRLDSHSPPHHHLPAGPVTAMSLVDMLKRVTSPEYLMAMGDITNPLELPGQPWFFTYREAFGYKAPVPLAFVLSCSALYLFIIFVIAPRLRPTTPAGIQRFKSFRFQHNVALFLFSALSCFGTAWHLYKHGEFTNFHKMTCDSTVENWLVLLNFAFVISKVWEWIDTVLLVVGAPDFRKLNFLHVYHHTTTFWLLLLVTNLPGCAKMGMLLNGGVHTLMYAHYAWPFPRAVVPLITIAQLAQLFYVTYLWTVTPSVCGGRFMTFFNEFPADFITPYAMVPVYIIFFLRFFINRWVLRKSHHNKKPKAQ